MAIAPDLALLDPATPSVVVGLISGTSADGVDAAVCRLAHPAGEPLRWEVLATAARPYPDGMGEALRAPRALDLPRLAALHVRVGAEFAAAARAVVEAAGLAMEAVDLIGSHGQTVWHDPRGALGGAPVSLQIGSAAVIAEDTRCAVWSDFRAADVAAGGEGAPFVPLVDHLLFADPTRWRVCLNLGGIANATLLPAGADGAVTAFDTGPANVVLDHLARRLLGTARDEDGAAAARGTVDAARLARALDDPYFALQAPKSTGPERFDAAWIEARFGPLDGLSTAAVEERFATAAALTVESVARALEGSAGTPAVPADAEILVSGGGRWNRAVMDGLARRLAPRAVLPVDARGLDGDAKEAVAFAVLAYESALGRPVNVPTATGARHFARCGTLAFPPPA